MEKYPKEYCDKDLRRFLENSDVQVEIPQAEIGNIA